jgi:putative PIN family toxin of toxin-antitoxin system
VRVVLDVNVLIAALLARDGSPAEILLRWLAGDFELIISDKLISELARALAYLKVRSRVSIADASVFVAVLEANATNAIDPDNVRRQSRDSGDDSLLALAASCSAVVVSGDRDLLALSADLPIYSPSEFLSALDK